MNGYAENSAAVPTTPLARIFANLERIENMASGLQEITKRIAGIFPEAKSTDQIKSVPNGLLEELNERLARVASSIGGDLERVHDAIRL